MKDALPTLSLTQLAVLVKRCQNDSIRGSGWNAFMEIRKAFKPSDVKSASWENWKSPKQAGNMSGGKPLWEPPDMWVESTYSDCIEWSYRVDSRVLMVTMYDGDMMDGHRRQRRCVWIFEVDAYCTFIPTLVKGAMNMVGGVAYRRYEAEQEVKFQRGVAAIAAKLMKDLGE